MSVKHIENLTVTNFKCFKHLEVTNIGRVNLIGGKNNVGKTAFLEAVELLVFPDNDEELAYIVKNILARRQSRVNNLEIDFIFDNQSEFHISSLNKNCTIQKFSGKIHINEGSGQYKVSPHDLFVFSVNDSKEEYSLDWIDISKKPKKFANNHIYTAKSSENDIAIALGILIDLDKEDFLNSSLCLFDKDIVELKQTVTEYGVILKLKLKNKNKLVLLSSLGEGVNRYIAILCAIWANKDGVLLIDEIENGIHYTNYKKLWEILFQASVAANCQLFITSHSKECISAFNEVQFEIENCSAQYYEFYRNLKNDLITASALDKEQLRYELTHEGRVRGE